MKKLFKKNTASDKQEVTVHQFASDGGDYSSWPETKLILGFMSIIIVIVALGIGALVYALFAHAKHTTRQRGRPAAVCLYRVPPPDIKTPQWQCTGDAALLLASMQSKGVACGF
jgi:hypothetical protein